MKMTTATDIPGRLDEMRGLHTRIEGDVCGYCSEAWPCEIAEVFTLVAAEVAHRVNPVIGWLRMNEHLGTAPKAVSIDRLREAVVFFTKEPK